MLPCTVANRFATGAWHNPPCLRAPAKAELAGIAKGSSIGVGRVAVAKGFGGDWALRVRSDATAATGICRRRGLGKMRRLAVAGLQVQDSVEIKEFALRSVLRSENPADMRTKHAARATLDQHMERCSLVAAEGRPECAPRMSAEQGREHPYSSWSSMFAVHSPPA